MKDLYARLQAVMERLEDLSDMNRICHYKGSVDVLESFSDYIEDYAEEDHNLIDEGIKAGITALVRIRRHTDLSESAVSLYGISHYVRYHLESDIMAIDEALQGGDSE